MEHISIVLPVLNGEETLHACLDSILAVDYPPQLLEVVAINDGSTDSTGRIFDSYREKFSIRGVGYTVITHEERKGRLVARENGARESEGPLLLFVDHRCVVSEGVLNVYTKRKYQPMISGIFQDPHKNLVSTFFSMVRRFIYRPYFGKSAPDVYIDAENFDRVAKGFCPFFCDKHLFLKSLPKAKGKHVNDDTAIFKNIIKKKKILRVADSPSEYLERNDFREMIWHFYERGPRFVNFYLKIKSRYTLFLIGIIMWPILAVISVIIAWLWSPLIFLPIVLVSVGCVSLLVRSFTELLALAVAGPVLLLVFTAGVYKGVVCEVGELSVVSSGRWYPPARM